MGWLFNFAYLIAGCVFVPICLWRKWLRNKPVAGLSEKLTGGVPIRPARTRRIWLHAVSVGEVNVLVHLLPRLQQRWPEYELIVSTTTRTGYDLAQRRFGSERTCFFPFDFTWSVRRALDRIGPDLIVLVELEVWPNLLRIAERRQIPVAIVNGRLGDDSFRTYRRFARLLRSSFAKLSWVVAQNLEYAERFANLGVAPSRVRVTGNLKFDGVRSDRENSATSQFRALLGGVKTQTVWLAGSTQEPEERIAIECYQSLRQDFPELRLIIAPRHPERCDEVVEQIRAHGLTAIRRTQIREPRSLSTDDVLIIDTVGELAAWWGLSDIAFVGGSLGDRGGQNMIEPAAFGCATSFGFNTKNFRDVVALLLSHEAAIVVEDRHALERFARRCLIDPGWRRELGLKAQRLVAAQTGATDQTISQLEVILAQSRSQSGRAA